MTLEEFKKLDLRVGQVIEAEKIEGSDKLLRLEIDLGDEWRQVVAGIGEYYTTEELINKQVVIVANLESKIIKNIESQGMILAAEDKNGNISLIVPDKKITPGSKVR